MSTEELDLEPFTRDNPLATLHDMALALVVHDDRDLSFAEKLADALQFLKRQIN